jgi:hypothetical protein
VNAAPGSGRPIVFHLPDRANAEIPKLSFERREVLDKRKLDSHLLAAKEAFDNISRAAQGDVAPGQNLRCRYGLNEGRFRLQGITCG